MEIDASRMISVVASFSIKFCTGANTGLVLSTREHHATRKKLSKQSVNIHSGRLFEPVAF
jgi:sulfite exporter TauE/SafE